MSNYKFYIYTQSKLLKDFKLKKKYNLNLIESNLRSNIIKLDTLFTIKRGKLIEKSSLSNEITDSHKFPVYSSKTLSDGILGYSDSYMIDQTVITWATNGSNAGKFFISKGKFSCTNVCGILIPKSNVIVDQALLYVINNHALSYINKEKVPFLYGTTVGSIEIPFLKNGFRQTLNYQINHYNELIKKEKLKLDSLDQEYKTLIDKILI